MFEINKKLSFITALTIFLLSGCQGGSSSSTRPSQTDAPLKTVTYRNGMMCQEKITPLFRSLGYQCICSSESDNYSVRSSKPGYTTECQNPVTWAIEQDKIAAQRAAEQKYKAEQERISEIKNAKKAKEFEETLKKIAPQVRPYCQSLERRKFNIVRACDTAGNPAYCKKSRDQTEPLPQLPRGQEALTPFDAMLICSTQRFDVMLF